MNIPDNLSAQDDPASDGDALVVICDQGGCMNSITIDDASKSDELECHGGVTCSYCVGENIKFLFDNYDK